MENRKQEGIKEVTFEYGSYFFKLEKLLIDKGISINQLIRSTGTDYKVIKRLIDGNLTRLDIQVVGRLCDYLQCDISDIFHFEPIKKRK